MALEIKPLGQRDSRWANERLGTSNTTIGGYGCTITCLTMLLNYYGYNETPSTVNKKLTNNNGFLNGNLLIWQAIPKIWDRIKFEWRGYGYNNDNVSKNLPCLVEVDFDGTTKTDDKHWVLFKGDKRMNDPWTGLDEPTSKYSILTGYAVITGTHGDNSGDNNNGDNNMADMYKGVDLNNKESVKVTVDLWYDIMNNNKKAITNTEYNSLLTDKKRKEELEKEVSSLKDSLNKVVSEYKKAEQAIIGGYELKLANLNKEFDKEKSSLEKDYKVQIDALIEELGTLRKSEELATKEVVSLSKKIKELGEKLQEVEGQLDLIKRVTYKGFNIPTKAWETEEGIMGALTKLSSGGSTDNLSIQDLFSLIFIKIGKIISKQ